MDFATLAETDAEDFVGNDCEIAGWGQTDGIHIAVDVTGFSNYNYNWFD